MTELLLYPIITGLVTGIFLLIFEHFVVLQKREENKLPNNQISFSIKYILTQISGIIIFEILIRTFFPKLNLPKELLEGLLKDSNLTFASVFYVSFTSILLTFESKNNALFFFGTHLLPYLSLSWWTFTFQNVFISSSSTFLPIVHNILLCWFFYGLRLFFKKLDFLFVLPFILFPINALFLLKYIESFSAWLGAFVTSVVMIIIVGAISDERDVPSKNNKFNIP